MKRSPSQKQVLYKKAYLHWAKKKPVYTGHFRSKVAMFHFKINLSLVVRVRVHQRCLPYLVLHQHLVAGIPEWELEARHSSPWQLVRRACQDPVALGCKSHRGELQNCTHQPVLEKRITMKSWKCMSVPASLNWYIFIYLFLPLSFFSIFVLAVCLRQRSIVSLLSKHLTHFSSVKGEK